MRASVAALTSSGSRMFTTKLRARRTPSVLGMRVPVHCVFPAETLLSRPSKHNFRETTRHTLCFHAAIQSQIGGQAVQTGSSGCVNSSNQSGSGGYVDCSGYASQASRR